MQKIISCLVVGMCLLVLSSCGAGPAKHEQAQRLLKLRGYNFDEKSFFAAAQARDLMAINAFIDAGMNPNAQDDDGRTALISAAARGDLETVNALIARSADVNVRDKRGYTALSHAIEARYDQVEDALLRKSNLDPNCRGLNGRPALSAYVWRDDKERFEKLLAHGADVKLEDNDGDTALHGAADSGNVEMIRVLLDKGADPNAKNKVGGTPLMWAAVRGNQEAAELLLKRGADPSLKDNDGITAAQWAAHNKRENIVQLFRNKR